MEIIIFIAMCIMLFIVAAFVNLMMYAKFKRDLKKEGLRYEVKKYEKHSNRNDG